MADYKIVAITFDEGKFGNVMIIPEHWNHKQSGFENADVYTVLEAKTEKPLGHFAFTEDKTDWQCNGELSPMEEHQIITFMKERSPLTSG